MGKRAPSVPSGVNLCASRQAGAETIECTQTAVRQMCGTSVICFSNEGFLFSYMSLAFCTQFTKLVFHDSW